MILTTHSVAETLALGRLIGRLAPPGTCIGLDGELGAGKTQLTRGIALGAAVDDPTLVSSPTYVLLNIYRGKKPVYHLDAYRIPPPTSAADFAAIGFDELVAGEGESGNGVVVVEWAEKIPELLPLDYLRITIEHGAESDAENCTRTLQFTANGDTSRALADQIRAQWAPAAAP